MQLAEELGLYASAQDYKELDVKAMATGIGRKATDEELMDYLRKDTGESPIPLKDAFSKYLNQK